MEAAQLIESRVDWLTASMMLQHEPDEATVERAINLGESLIRRESGKGNPVVPWSFCGFNGSSTGGVGVGVNAAGMVFRLSGDAARDHWKEVHQATTNVSRIDVAGTVRLNGEWCDLTRQHLDEARAYQAEHSPRMKVLRLDGGKAGSTLAIGSRSSDSYGRIYDKYRESKREEYRDCWRYEVEFKRDKAKQLAQLLADDQAQTPEPAAVASEWFARRGCTPLYVLASPPTAWASYQPTSDARRLHWLRTGVRGSVASLIERGHRAEVLEALGL